MKTKILTIVQALGLGLLLTACQANKMVGPVDIDGDGKTDGEGYDQDGDGKVDAIDVDGDGVIDGNDYDGDGEITIWEDLQGDDLLVPTEAMEELNLDELDPDLIDNVDPMNPPPGMTGGTVPIQSAVLLATPETFTALSQGAQGSCAAFANAELATLVRAKREKASPNSVVASAAFLYERQVRESKVMCGSGTYAHEGLNALVKEGAATSVEVPYGAEEDAAICASGSMAAQGHKYRIGSWSQLSPFSRDKIKKTLSTGKPIMFGISLPAEFFDWHGEQATGVFAAAGTCTGSSHCGGHAMLMVGYDDTKGAYRILNSWGGDWGDRGYIWWKYEDFDARGAFGYAITELPAAALTPFAAPNPATFDLKPIGVVTYSMANDDGSKDWYVNVRVQASEPFQVTESTLTNSVGTFSNPLDSWLAYGDVNFFAGTGNAPPQEMTVTHINGKLRNGTAVAKDLIVLVPAPAK